MLFSAILSALTLFGIVNVGAVTITRTSLFGYDVRGVGSGLSLDEAAIALETLSARVTSAVDAARRALAHHHLLAVEYVVRFGVDENGYNAAFIRATLPNGECGTRQEREAIDTLVYFLRENILAASPAGRLQATARLFGDEALAVLDEPEERLAGQHDERW